MKKLSLSIFREIFANSIIVVMLVFLFSLTYAGGVMGVFATTTDTPIYYGNATKKQVSLMINVYWGTEYIRPMLDIFDEHNVKTTFFVGGLWVSKNNELLQEIFERGHEIGNHGFYHKDHKKLSLEQNQQEIYTTHQLVASIIGVQMNLFAPPSGSFSATTLQVAKDLGYKTIMWSKDTIDWRDQDQNLILQRATKKPSNGDLILMHPTKATVLALDQIIKFYEQNGFNLTTVSQNIAN
jgi:probable sporulation protein (polysaccharide deacetylase family)